MTCWNGLYGLFFIAGSLVASLAKGEGDDPAPRDPPPDMVAACDNRAAGDSCSVTFKGQTIEGTCRSDPRGDGPLACFAKGPPPGGPPPEAVEACNGRAADDSCTVNLKDRTIDGTCRSDPHRDGSLVCVPSNPRARSS